MSKQFEERPRSIGVIGGGVAGLVTALSLKAAGFNVHLYEKNTQLSEETCSWFAGGMIAPWCERDGADDLVRDRGVEALAWWAEHCKTISQNGSLVLSAARDRSEVIRFSRLTQEHISVGEREINDLEPALSGRFQEGLFYPREAHIDPRIALPELERRFLKAGGEVTRGQEVIADDLLEEVIVDCRGLSARRELKTLRGVRGEMIRIHSSEVSFSRPIRLLHPRQPVYVVPRGNGILMVGATSIESDCHAPVTVRSAYELLEAVQRLHPALGEASIIEMSAGVRPALPDNIPNVEQRGRIIYANGLYRHGFLLSPWCARQIVELLQGAKGTVV